MRDAAMSDQTPMTPPDDAAANRRSSRSDSSAPWTLEAAKAVSEYLVTGMHHGTREGRKAMADIIAKHAPRGIAVVPGEWPQLEWDY